MTDKPGWPDPTKAEDDLSKSEIKKRKRILFRAKVEEARAKRAAWEAGQSKKPPPPGADDKRKALIEADAELYTEYHKAVAQVATDTIQRARSGVEFVEKATVAILGVYTGVLGVVFSVTDNPLPSVGVIPAFFFALSIALAAVYLAFVKQADPPPGRETSSIIKHNQDLRTAFFVRWTMAIVRNKKSAARISVAALIAGVLFLPSPFLSIPDDRDLSVAERRVEDLQDDVADLTLPAAPAIGGAATDEMRLAAYQALLDNYTSRVDAAVADLQAAQETLADLQEQQTTSVFWLTSQVIWIAAGVAVILAVFAPLVYGWLRDP